MRSNTTDDSSRGELIAQGDGRRIRRWIIPYRLAVGLFVYPLILLVLTAIFSRHHSFEGLLTVIPLYIVVGIGITILQVVAIVFPWILFPGRVSYYIDGTRIAAYRGDRMIREIDVHNFGEIGVTGKIGRFGNGRILRTLTNGPLDGLTRIETRSPHSKMPTIWADSDDLYEALNLALERNGIHQAAPSRRAVPGSKSFVVAK